MRLTKNKPTQFIFILAVFILVTGVWELTVSLAHVKSYILPPPSEIAKYFCQFLTEPLFWKDVGVTLFEILAGFAVSIVIAIIMGALIARFIFFEISLLPYFIGFQVIPSITLAPIISNCFGYDMTSKIIMVVTVSSFPIMMMVVAGLQSSSVEQIQMLRSFGATRRQILMKVQIPNALPFFFTGLRLGVVMAVTGAIVAEFQISTSGGLGYRIHRYYEYAQIAQAFAAIFALSLLGITLHGILGRLRSIVVFWVNPHGGMV